MSQGEWWTADEDERLIALNRQHMRKREIARRLGRGYASVTSRLSTLRDQGRIEKISRKKGEGHQNQAQISYESYETSQRQDNIIACDGLLKLLREHHVMPEPDLVPTTSVPLRMHGCSEMPSQSALADIW